MTKQLVTKSENFITVPLSGFEAALKGFLADAKAKSDDRFATHYPNSTPPTYSTEPGSKNIRIVVTGPGNNRSVHCFVRKSDGAILKAAGWKAPFIAKGGPNAPMTIRGSIFDPTTFNPSRWA